MKSISADNFLNQSHSQKSMIIDVRDPDEFEFQHIPDSVNIPLNDLQKKLNQIPRDQSVFVICQSGVRSQEACQKLDGLGFASILSIEGGVNAYKQAGGHVVKTSNVLPLMRQVQIGAGFLVILGIVLSHIFHPYFIGVSLFVGCGLMFAGVTGYCGMARILALMPWNANRR